MQFTVRYTDRQARRNLKELRRAVEIGEEVGIRRAAQVIARLMLRAARARSPYRTGHLRRSLTVRRTQTARDRQLLELTIKDRSAFYAFILDAGYPRGRYRNWIEDSFRDVEPQMSNIIQDEVALAIRAQIAIAGITPPSGG